MLGGISAFHGFDNARSGYYQDRETGLYLCQHRFYDPANGRWLNRDPIGFAGGTNLYAYCAGGPVGVVDSSGFEGGDLPEVVAELAADAADPDVFGDPAGGAGGGLGGSGRAAAAAAAAAATAALGADPDLPDEAGSLLNSVCSMLSDGGQQGAESAGSGHPLFRLVEPAEQAALRANGGYATNPPFGTESKYFWQTEEQVQRYMQKVPPHWGPFEIWQWPNPAGVGGPGAPVDGIPGLPWLIPNGQLPELPPGVRVG